tara:strand:- start:1236 stop:1820 length:585 start_codon:yes stop_codon:yes gene_type:complete
MSQLKVNSIIPVGGVASGQGGGVIQTIRTVKTDVFTASAITVPNGGTDGLALYNLATAVTNFTVSITPISSTNILMLDISIGNAGLASANTLYAFVTKGGNAATNFFGDKTGTNSNRASFARTYIDNSYAGQMSFRGAEVAGTTSQITYGLKVASGVNLVLGSTGSHLTGNNAADGLAFIATAPLIYTVREVSA